MGIETKFWLVQTVMVMYEKARTTVRTKQGSSEEFEVKDGVYQGSVLSLLLFVAVMEVVTQKVREGLPWELLYADDLVLVAQSIEKLREKVQQWKTCMESKGLKMNMQDDVVLHHTLPVFMGLGWCPIVSWDFCWSSEHFWTRCPSCHPPMTFTGIRTRDLSRENRCS